MPAMIQELVWALPPLGGARVLDLLGQYRVLQLQSDLTKTSPLFCSW